MIFGQKVTFADLRRTSLFTLAAMFANSFDLVDMSREIPIHSIDTLSGLRTIRIYVFSSI